jgi:hypothetical protein
MRKSSLLVCSAAMLTAFLGSTAYAQSSEGQSRPERRAHPANTDANNDRVITYGEYMAAAEKRFNRMDLNHDGNLTAEERKAARQPRSASRRRAR